MPSAGYLRRQADICLRLSLIASDEEAQLLAIYHDYKAKADAMDAEAEVPEDAMAHPDASPGAEKYGAG